MAFKLIVLAALFALVNAGEYPTSHVTFVRSVHYAHQQPPVAYTHEKDEVKNYDQHYNTYPKYTFSYDVHDGHTGDIKAQQETRDGDVVKGSYSFIEADGSRRIVEYIADSHNGFNAVVHKQPAPTVAYTTVAPVTYEAYDTPSVHPTYPHHH